MSIVRTEFEVHRLNELGMAKASAIAEAFSDLLTSVESVCPPSRERSLVITKLQEASFWAKRAMAVVPENQEIRP